MPPFKSYHKYFLARNRWSPYLLAVVLTAMDLWLRILVLSPVLGESAPYATLIPVVAIVALYGGFWPGMAAAMAGALADLYYVVPPPDSFALVTTLDRYRFGFILTAGVLVSALGGALHYLVARLEAEIETRKETQKRLDELNHMKDAFLATLSHELRNPLAPIANAVEILRAAADKESRLNIISVLDRQLHQITQLIDDLMDMARITQNKITIRPEPVLLSTSISEAVESIRPFATEKRQKILVSLPGEAVYVNGDPTRLAEIFGNILVNAVKYTKNGGTIRVDASAADGEAVIVISDNGIGIAPDMLPRLFEMFMQVGDGGNRKMGIGIGLALVKKLVLLHHGSISAQSDGLGKGSRFTIRLPTAEGGKSAPRAGAAPQAVAETGRRKVLVIDDSVDSAQTLAWMMEAQGHDVRLATDGPSGIAAAKEFLPDIVLLDIGMPVMDGYEVCRALRQTPSLKDAFIIAQTGYGQPADRQRTTEAGFDAHVIKPVPLAVIQALIHGRRTNEGLTPPPAATPGTIETRA